MCAALFGVNFSVLRKRQSSKILSHEEHFRIVPKRPLH